MMKFLALVLILALFCYAQATPKTQDIESLSGKHAKLLLTLFEQITRRSNSTYGSCHSLFEAGPKDSCCTVWKYIQCAEIIDKCVDQCETGIQNCITCVGPLWEDCCCCIQNLGVKISCPECCG